MANDKPPSTPLSLSSAQPVCVRFRQGVELPGRGSIKRAETKTDNSPGAFSSDVGDFELSMTPIGVMVVDLRPKNGGRFLVPWVNIDSVQLAEVET